MRLKKLIALLTSVFLAFYYIVPCYALSFGNNDFCSSEISPLYEITDSAKIRLDISGTTASCQTVVTVTGVSTITVVQTLQKHWVFGIYNDVADAKWTKALNGIKLIVSGTKMRLFKLPLI